MMQPSDFTPVPAESVTNAGFTTFLEGPAQGPDGAIYFSDIKGDRLLRRAPDGEITVFRFPSGRANGNVFDLEGRLVTCEGSEYGPGGGRRMVRTDLASGETTVLTDRFGGGRYNSPNDVTVDARGRIFFTDPCYNSHTTLEQDAEAVYRIDPDGAVERIVEQPAIERPNGVAIAPGADELYLVDSNHSPGGHRKLWAFRLDDVGRVHDQRLVWDFAPGRGGDGVEVAADGTLFVCAGINAPRSAGETALYPTGVYLLTPAGDALERIPVPEDVISNCCFGGDDLRTLYITAGKTLYAVEGVREGYHAFPSAPRAAA
jgi:gluconolactonase